MRVLYRVRPYEKVKGSANHLHEVWKKRCIKSLEKARYGEFKKNIRGIIRDFDRLPITDEKKPRVGIVGEILVISLEDKDADEAMMDALDAGAEDFDAGEEAAEITTDPENYSAVVKAMEEKGYEILSDDLAMVPMTTTRLTDPDQLKAMGKLLDSLEDNDDVQNVWHSLENEEDLPE